MSAGKQLVEHYTRWGYALPEWYGPYLIAELDSESAGYNGGSLLPGILQGVRTRAEIAQRFDRLLPGSRTSSEIDMRDNLRRERGDAMRPRDGTTAVIADQVLRELVDRGDAESLGFVDTLARRGNIWVVTDSTHPLAAGGFSVFTSPTGKIEVFLAAPLGDPQVTGSQAEAYAGLYESRHQSDPTIMQPDEAAAYVADLLLRTRNPYLS